MVSLEQIFLISSVTPLDNLKIGIFFSPIMGNEFMTIWWTFLEMAPSDLYLLVFMPLCNTLYGWTFCLASDE